VDFAAWCRTTRPVIDARTVVLRGLARLAQAQVLYGLQERCRQGIKTKLHTLGGLCQRLRADGIDSLLDLDVSRLPNNQRGFVRTVQPMIIRAFSSPEVERRKDRWDMVVFGHRGTLDFTAITQPWLRAGIQDWVSEELPAHRGPQVTNVVREYVRSIEQLSDSLRLQRPDHGDNSAVLGRADVVAFLNRIGHLEDTQQLSGYQHRQITRRAAMVLRGCRAFGLTNHGQPMVGLPDDFTLRQGDVPREPKDDEPGRALPPVILRQLTAALPKLDGRYCYELQVAIQLLMDTGRRPDEICQLPWDCLEQDADGKHTLVYTDFKAHQVGRRLAIADATAKLIRDQQQAVRARFPGAPISVLALLPAATRNPKGTRPITKGWLARVHRRWADELPTLLLDDDNRTEFDKAKVFLYAYRHSYAQRHADAGIAVDELRELMGHDSMETTQRYYRVTAKRTRAAVDKVAAFQFDGRGKRIWREARALLEHEHQRRAVGQVAVPFGICTEPSNVQADGHACPFRFRCVGCGHFRSDPSYLPELRGYLDMLLRNRERVRAATELEEWARAEATPSDEEISRLRTLIRRVETDLEQLGDDERRQIEEACRVVRTTRKTVHLGMPTIRPSDLDPNLAPTLEDLA
jgi:integrase